MLLKLLIFSKKTLYRRQKTFFVTKNYGFVDWEFVKICHEQVRYFAIKWSAFF